MHTSAQSLVHGYISLLRFQRIRIRVTKHQLSLIHIHFLVRIGPWTLEMLDQSIPGCLGWNFEDHNSEGFSHLKWFSCFYDNFYFKSDAQRLFEKSSKSFIEIFPLWNLDKKCRWQSSFKNLYLTLDIDLNTGQSSEESRCGGGDSGDSGLYMRQSGGNQVIYMDPACVCTADMNIEIGQ